MTFKPETQKWLTNVIIVQIDIQSNHFELACYHNKINAFRNGTETDLSNVLQTEDIFSNVTQGELATNASLQTAFQTLNKTTICNRIIKEGKLQLTTLERRHEATRLRKEIIAQAQGRCTHSATGKCVPFAALENAMREVNFQPNSFPASEQAATFIAEIQAQIGGLVLSSVGVLLMWKGEGSEKLKSIGISVGDGVEDGEWRVEIADIGVDQVRGLKELRGTGDVQYFVEKSFGVKVK